MLYIKVINEINLAINKILPVSAKTSFLAFMAIVSGTGFP